MGHRGPYWIGKNERKQKLGHWSSLDLVGKNLLDWNALIYMRTLHLFSFLGFAIWGIGLVISFCTFLWEIVIKKIKRQNK